MLEALKEAMQIIESLPARKHCRNCASWSEGYCKANGDVKPPPEVIERGCKAWQWDEVPF